ncbi:phosphoribosylanthranilate isomerase [Planctomicrobium sp. SH661]|uniref:phosphoribosylanthranilate isomerase n=1 Tax=Planctomicrobium sp. SH661 TaxID=3448124 RepID=UPI003F5B2775
MWVKICGISQPAVAAEIAAFSPDAIGLNFYAKSPRCVGVDAARKIVSLLPQSITPIGLFVNHAEDEIRAICESCGIRVIQLHGDETPEFVRRLSDFEIIRAFRVGDDGLDDLSRQLDQYRELGVKLKGCLIDAKVQGAYGGTGHRAPWELLASGWRSEWPPLILAGGLNPDVVADAIAAVAPWGVDVASGVESSPGRQNVAAVEKFIRAARGTPSDG